MAEPLGTPQERKELIDQWTALELERSTWDRDYRECADYIDPWNYRRDVSDTNRGGLRASQIINDTAGEANDIQAAGMMSGITNPAMPWCALKASDPDLNNYGPAREWMDIAIERLMRMFSGSNIYQAFHEGYLNLGQYGTHAQILLDDKEDIIRAYIFPVGEYCLAISDREAVDTVFRKFRLTAKQMVQWFGLESVSQNCRDAYKDGRKTQQFDVLHALQPNDDFKRGALGTKGKKYLGTYIELGATNNESNLGFLLRDGYYENPTQTPRWRALAGNVYGVGPGLRGIGDIKGLQELERQKGRAVEKIVDPPMVGPSSMANDGANILPGGMNYVDNVGPNTVFRPAMDIPPNAISAVESSIRPHELRVRSKFNADMWIAMQRGEGSPQKTAREIAELHEEKMMLLGPVMQSLEREYLGPVVNRGLAMGIRTGQIPMPPKELIQDGKLSYGVEYLSIVAQALKMLSNGGMESAAAFAGRFVGVKPDVVDVLDVDGMVREFATNVGMKAALIRDPDQVAQIRQQRQAQQQAEAQAEQAQKLAMGAKTLSETDMGGDNGLTRLLANLPAGATGGGVQ